ATGDTHAHAKPWAWHPSSRSDALWGTRLLLLRLCALLLAFLCLWGFLLICLLGCGRLVRLRHLGVAAVRLLWSVPVRVDVEPAGSFLGRQEFGFYKQLDGFVHGQLGRPARGIRAVDVERLHPVRAEVVRMVPGRVSFLGRLSRAHLRGDQVPSLGVFLVPV